MDLSDSLTKDSSEAVWIPDDENHFKFFWALLHAQDWEGAEAVKPPKMLFESISFGA